MKIYELRKELDKFMKELQLKDVIYKSREEIVNQYIKKLKDDIKRHTKEDNIK
jgi:hypothetical protein